MSGSFSNFQATAILQHMLGSAAYTIPGHHYLALATVLPDDTTTGTTIKETDYSAYARTEIGTGNNITDAWNAVTGTLAGTVTNKNAITCPTALGASTNPIVGVAVVDASSVGNVVTWASVTSTPIALGDTPTVNAAGYTVTLD